jgi:FkbM family methyltransferase
VDAGANEGWYSWSLSPLFDRVLSFEPNEALLGDLRVTRRRNIEAYAIALSNWNGTAQLHVPTRGGIALTGWGSLDRDHLEARDGVVSSTVSTRTLDSFRLDALDFLKVDVEGHELQLLLGSQEALRRFRPRVLIEILPANVEAVSKLLGDCGLERVEAVREDLPLTRGNYLFRSASISPLKKRSAR